MKRASDPEAILDTFKAPEKLTRSAKSAREWQSNHGDLEFRYRMKNVVFNRFF